MENNISLELYHELCQVLYHEAHLLDTQQFEEWLAMMTDDIKYEVPVRLTRERGNEPDYSMDMLTLDEDQATLRLRVNRLKTDFAWAEDPPSRTRRFVTNVVITPGERPDELNVRSYLLIYRSRGADADSDLISCERRDVWVRVDGRWLMDKRFALIDQATIGTKNFAIFL